MEKPSTTTVSPKIVDNTDKIDFELTTESMDGLIIKHQDYCNGVNSFTFNIFEFSQLVGRNMQMPILATALMK